MTQDPQFDIEQWARHSSHVPLTQPTAGVNVRALHDEGNDLDAGHTLFRWRDHEFEVVSLKMPRQFEDVRLSWVISAQLADFTALFEAVVAFNREVHGEVLVFSAGCFDKDADLQTAIEATEFAELVLPSALANGLQADLRQFLESQQLYRDAGAVWKRGVLLLGPPGNGKTHAIKALVRQTRLPCLYVKSFTGRHKDPAETIPVLFRRARQLAPCVVVLEDLDSLVDDENRSYLLNELDGFAVNDGIITIASSNHPERLDPSLLHRPSRFDRKYRFDLPTDDLRRLYLDRWAAKVPDGVDADAIAKAASATDGFTFAYLKEVGLSTQMQWASEGRRRPIGKVLLEVVDALKAEIVAVSNAPPQPPAPKRPRYPYD